jgi:hypothetical protein
MTPKRNRATGNRTVRHSGMQLIKSTNDAARKKRERVLRRNYFNSLSGTTLN